jgi:uncharacterized membrane protein
VIVPVWVVATTLVIGLALGALAHLRFFPAARMPAKQAGAVFQTAYDAMFDYRYAMRAVANAAAEVADEADAKRKDAEARLRAVVSYTTTLRGSLHELLPREHEDAKPPEDDHAATTRWLLRQTLRVCLTRLDDEAAKPAAEAAT